MAKRKEVQLQTDLQTDEEFDRFLEQPGLLVIDVYTDWCGPCQGMLSGLRKVKMEQGGDQLNLAIARADTISYLNRFFKKSEPTWLFIADGRSVNIMFGSNCPNLMSLINAELKALGKSTTRETYNITDMLPIEVEFDNIKNAAKRAQIQKEIDEKEHKHSEYFHYVTDTIRENLPDIGITFFGPHTTREAFRHLLDYGLEKFNIQCKDRRNQPITKEQFETINYVCRNPLPPDVIDATDGKEWYISFWKVTDELKEPVPEVLQRFADDIVKPHKLPPDEYRNEEVIPPIISNAKVEIEYELPAGEECPKQEELESEKPTKKDARAESPHGSAIHDAEHQEVMDIEEGESEDEENEGGEGHVDEPKLDDLGADYGITDSLLSDGEEEEEAVDDTPQKNICKKFVTIPAVWVPKDKRTHAAIIYTLFRGQTNAFLPPDPVPDPPHVVMAFDTYKKKDLIDFAERNKEDIPVYGFFTSEEADEAKFIASSKQKYLQSTPAASDKLVFRVNKRTSHTMLSLATYGPTYVSPNTTVGAQEAKIFFPEDYVTAEMEQEELEALKKEEKKKSRKGKLKDETVEEQESYERLQAEAAIREAEEAAKAAEKDPEAKGMKAEGQIEGETEGEGFEGGIEGEGLEGGDIGEGIELPTEIQPDEPIGIQPVEEAQAPQTETAEIATTEPAVTEIAPAPVETATDVPV